MGVNQPVDLLAHGLMAAGLNLVGHRIAPDFAGTVPFFANMQLAGFVQATHLSSLLLEEIAP